MPNPTLNTAAQKAGGMKKHKPFTEMDLTQRRAYIKAAQAFLGRVLITILLTLAKRSRISRI